MSDSTLPVGSSGLYGVWGEYIGDGPSIEGEPIQPIEVKPKSQCECGAHVTYGLTCDSMWHSDWCKLSPYFKGITYDKSRY